MVHVFARENIFKNISSAIYSIYQYIIIIIEIILSLARYFYKVWHSIGYRVNNNKFFTPKLKT